MGKCVRSQITTEESTEYFDAIYRNKQALFGIVKLSGLELDHPYPSPRGIIKWFSHVTLLQFALFKKSWNIAAALLRGGASLLWYDNVNSVEANSSTASSVGVVSTTTDSLDTRSVTRTIQRDLKSCAYRTNCVLWLLRAIVMLEIYMIERVREQPLSSPCCCHCNSPMRLLYWPCCGNVVCYWCFWKHGILKMETDSAVNPSSSDGTNEALGANNPMVGKTHGFLMPDINCMKCGCLYSNLERVKDDHRQCFSKWNAGVKYIYNTDEIELGDWDACMERKTNSTNKFIQLKDTAKAGRAQFEAMPRYIQRTTAWQSAITIGDSCRVYSLLDAGVDLDAMDEYGQNAVFWCLTNREYDMMKVLLYYGADYALRDYMGFDCLDALWGLILGNYRASSARLSDDDLHVITDEIVQVVALFRKALGDELCAAFLLSHNANIEAKLLERTPDATASGVYLTPYCYPLAMPSATGSSGDMCELLFLAYRIAEAHSQDTTKVLHKILISPDKSTDTIQDSGLTCDEELEDLVTQDASHSYEEESFEEQARKGSNHQQTNDEFEFAPVDSVDSVELNETTETIAGVACNTTVYKDSLVSECMGCIHYNFSNSTENAHLMISEYPEMDDKHPGGNGSFIIDNVIDDSFIQHMMELLRDSSLPVAAATKVSCSDRSYVNDTSGYLRESIRRALQNVCTKCGGRIQCSVRSDGKLLPQALLGRCENDNVDMCRCTVKPRTRFRAHPRMRVLDYRLRGGDLAPHIDLSKTMTNAFKTFTSSHTFIIYLQSTSDHSGETVLLDKHCSGGAKILASVSPVRSRLLVFPHDCPHAGLKGTY